MNLSFELNWTQIILLIYRANNVYVSMKMYLLFFFFQLIIQLKKTVYALLIILC